MEGGSGKPRCTGHIVFTSNMATLSGLKTTDMMLTAFLFAISNGADVIVEWNAGLTPSWLNSSILPEVSTPLLTSPGPLYVNAVSLFCKHHEQINDITDDTPDVCPTVLLSGGRRVIRSPVQHILNNAGLPTRGKPVRGIQPATIALSAGTFTSFNSPGTLYYK